MILKNILILLALVCILPAETLYSQIAIDTSFEGANARVLSINNSANTVKVESILRSGDVHNVVFYFKVSGFNVNQPLKIQVKYTQQYYLPVLAAYSYDKINWFRITGVFSGDSKEFVHTYSQNTVYFAHGYPYIYNDLLNLESQYSSSPFFTITNLAQSISGRNIKLFRITEPCVNDSGKFLIWVLGRNHAMESHSNYVLQGLIDFLASGDPKADMLRRLAIIYIVPVMDVDKAFNGGTGKDQQPIDFNRDWDSPSYWPAVIAVKQKILETSSQNQLKIFLDSHNPFPGQNDNNTWFYSRQETGIRSANLDLFRKLLFENGNYVFNRQPLYATDGQTSATWVDSMFSNIDFSTSMETGWVQRTDNTEWTIPLYKLHGAVIGKGFCDYISNIIKTDDIIIDNTDTLNGVTITGSWLPSTFVTGFWGINYIHDNNTGQGTKSIRYSPMLPAQGFYEVFIRYTSDVNRASNLRIRITHSSGQKDTVIDQRTKGSRWLSLGMYNFNQGNGSSVVISNTGANGYVIADAVKFSPRVNCNPIGIIQNSMPVNFKLNVFPNPFNPSCEFSFNLSRNASVKINIFDVTGKLVDEILNDNLSGGQHSINLNMQNFSSGVYFYKMEVIYQSTPPELLNGKLVLLK